MVYIAFIDGIILMPIAVNMNVREVWIFMVIYKYTKTNKASQLTSSKYTDIEINLWRITKASIFSLIKNEDVKI